MKKKPKNKLECISEEIKCYNQLILLKMMTIIRMNDCKILKIYKINRKIKKNKIKWILLMLISRNKLNRKNFQKNRKKELFQITKKKKKITNKTK